MRRALAVPAVFALLSSCTGETTGLGDASVPAAADAYTWTPIVLDPPAEPARPHPAELPAAPSTPSSVSMEPCPRGWAASTSSRAFPETICRPWVGSLPDCTGAEHLLPGATECTRIGPPCPVGQWPEDLLPMRDAYVDPSAPPGGDGTEALPFDRISTALATATQMTRLVLAKGVYEEDLVLDREITLRGACVEETILGNVRVTGPSVELSTVTARGVQVEGTGTLGLESVLVEGTGIVDRGSRSVYGDDLIIRGGGVTVGGNLGGTVLYRVTIEDAPQYALHVEQGTVIGLADAVIKNSGRGAARIHGGLIAERLVVLDNTGAGLWVDGPGALLDLDHSWIERVAPDADDGEFGRGIELTGGSSASVDRTAILAAHEVGFLVNGAGTTARVKDVVVLDTETRPNGSMGRGVYVGAGAMLEAERLVVDGAHDIGLLSIGSGARFSGRDVVVRDVSSSTFGSGDGVSAREEGRVELRRAAVQSAGGAGVLVAEGGTALLEDLVVSDLSGRSAGDRGHGIYFSRGAGELGRVRIERARTAAFLIANESRVSASDLTISEIESERARGLFGRGVSVQSGAELSLERASIDRCRNSGVHVVDASLRANDLRVQRTTPSLANGVVSQGVRVEGTAFFEGTRVELVENERAGLLATDSTTIAVSDLSITRTDSDPTGTLGIGLAAVQTSSGAPLVILDRAELRENHHHGIYVAGARTRLSARDVSIADTRGRVLDGAFGCGLYLANGAGGEVDRLSVERNLFAGIGLSGAGTRAAFTDLLVRDTLPDGTGIYGNGLGAEREANVRVLRGQFLNNRQIGILAQSGAELELRHVQIAGTKTITCPGDRCEDIGGGIGLGLWGSHALGEYFSISDNQLAGVTLSAGGTADLSSGEVFGHPIGINVETQNFDLERIRDGVVFRDNQRNLDALELPVPKPHGELPDLD